MAFRQRLTDFPRTFFLYRKKHRYYLLCWLEHGKDDSIYLWFDDDSSKPWELRSKHSLSEIRGTKQITLENKKYEIYDPHVSWHPSGTIHVSGYDKVGNKSKKIISDRRTHSMVDINSGYTIPFSQIIFPTINLDHELKYLGKSMPIDILQNKYFVILNKNGYDERNKGALHEAYYIIDDKLLPKNFTLGLDFCIHDKKIIANPIGVFGKDLLFPSVISIRKGATQNAVGLRIFGNKIFIDPKSIKSIIATCFNQESNDFIELKRLLIK